MRRAAAALLLLILAAAPQACKRKQPRVPPAPQQPPVTQPKPEPEPPSSGVTIVPGEPKVAPPVEPPEPEPEPEPVVPPEPEPEPPEPVVEPKPAPEPPAPPAPSLTPLLSPEEQSRYRTQTDASLSRARRNVSILAQRQLSDAQKADLNRVRTFMSQAETVRSRDLATAVGLARRADLLSAELVNTTQ